jgi:hypothetical protein
MRPAQILQFDQRQSVGRRRNVPAGSTAVVIQLFGSRTRRVDASARPAKADEDRFAGRGRDPG